MTIDGRQIAAVVRSTDTFELRDNVMLWTKSTSVIEKKTDSSVISGAKSLLR